MKRRSQQHKIPLFAVIRYQPEASSPEFRVTVKEVLPSADEAEAEARRLNRLVTDSIITYFCQPTRYYPDGLGMDDLTGT